jgi:tRNA-splicing ligase RtcB
MGTESYILIGTSRSEELAFSSACHGAGRSMSRTQATKLWQGRKLIEELAAKGVLIRTRSYRGVAEEAPGAYKDVNAVAEAAEQVGLATRVVRLVPLICVKG